MEIIDCYTVSALWLWDCQWLCSGPWFNIKMSSYQYRMSHFGDKSVVRSSCLHNGISYTGKMSSLHWIRALVIQNGNTYFTNRAGYKYWQEQREFTTRRSENDNTPQPLDQWTNSPFIGQQVGNYKSFTLTHYLADLFAMHRGPRSISLCIQHHIQLTSLSFQVSRPSHS